MNFLSLFLSGQSTDFYPFEALLPFAFRLFPMGHVFCCLRYSCFQIQPSPPEGLLVQLGQAWKIFHILESQVCRTWCFSSFSLCVLCGILVRGVLWSVGNNGWFRVQEEGEWRYYFLTTASMSPYSCTFPCTINIVVWGKTKGILGILGPSHSPLGRGHGSVEDNLLCMKKILAPAVRGSSSRWYERLWLETLESYC